ncbi:MAG: hypothetical protein HY519_02865 [Candidatus Aenigmarchaeota archaeon]|nr:hypothetical protein [Candidatus Aenigmarchaeota archaeon]
MAKLEISDDCFAPRKYVALTFKGKDPWVVIEQIAGSLRGFFHLERGQWNMYRINWDASEDTIFFFARWWVARHFSEYSAMHLEIKTQGYFNKNTRDGEFWLEFEGTVRTHFHTFGSILKPFWYLYSYLFYNNAKRSYVEQCRAMTLSFRDTVKKKYGLQSGPELAAVVD